LDCTHLPATIRPYPAPSCVVASARSGPTLSDHVGNRPGSAPA